MNRRMTRVLFFALVGGLGASCGTLDPKPRTGAGPAAPPRASEPGAAPRALEPVRFSAIREQAIAVIERSAKDADPQVRANAMEAAALLPARLESVIAGGLSDQSPAVRSVAAMAAGRASLVSCTNRVYALLNDPTAHVRASALYALVRFGADVDRSPLATMLLDDPSPWVRRHAAYLLGELGDPSALPLLRAAAVEPYTSASREQARIFQLQIAEAMAKLGDANARESLRAALYPSRPEDLESSAMVIQMLGQMRDRVAGDQLVYLARYRDRQGNAYPAEIRLAVAGALAALEIPDESRTAEEFMGSTEPVLRAQAAFVLGERRERSSAEALATLLQDVEPMVRIAAAAAVVKSGDRR